ncbi:MAG: CpsD/CapB family tyrosine-protein kinase [Ardenticatenaceae bacterium]|nr:CpsD/CapB family tyrosine-protein kinase [Ardenticatenaceae bacterium]
MSLITIEDPQAPQSEAYRTLRTNLSFYSLDEPLRTLVITSPAPNEETAVMAANLAVTIAQSGRKIVLVECDLRRPSLHTLLEKPVEPGLTNTLLGDEDLPLQQTAVENLWLLASGPKPPNPADLLGSRKIDLMIETLLDQVDMVLFHAPPVIAVTDATVLGAKVDGILLVIESGQTRRDHAQKAKEMLEKARVRIVGVALTNAAQDRSIGNYY